MKKFIDSSLTKKQRQEAAIYRDIELTKYKNLVREILLIIMQQYYNHVELFKEYNQKKNKKYNTMRKDIFNQLIFMEKTIALMNKFLKEARYVTKEDIYLLIMKYNIQPRTFNEIVYISLFNYVKEQLPDKVFEEEEIISEASYFGCAEYSIPFKNIYTSIGKPDIKINQITQKIKDYIIINPSQEIDILNNISLILNDYHDDDFDILDCCYRSSIINLINLLEIERKPNQLIKKLDNLNR